MQHEATTEETSKKAHSEEILSSFGPKSCQKTWQPFNYELACCDLRSTVPTSLRNSSWCNQTQDKLLTPV